MIGLVAATPRGARLAEHLAASLPGARHYESRSASAVRAAWSECDALVLFMATGAAVRLTAPLLADKRRDPGVVCVDDAGRFAVALAGGHEGGANALAVRVADALGAQPVVTTASDALAVPSLESLGADLAFRVDPSSDLAAVGVAMVSAQRVTLAEDQRWPLPALPENVIRTPVATAPCLLVTDRIVDAPRPAVVYRPPSLAVGVGCSRGAPAEEITGLVDETLSEACLSSLSVALVTSVEVKRDEPGLIEAAASRGWRLTFRDASELARVTVPNPSDAVNHAVGTPSVAEASVVDAGGELVVPKRHSRHVTVAVGRLRPRGRLFVVGTGPGSDGLITPMAKSALARSEIVIGLERYVDQIRAFLRPGTRTVSSQIGNEIERAHHAVAESSGGKAVALVSGGDAGVYAMASPALERAPADLDVECVPGVTAANASAALLGSPLGHDHCSISLSDLLTPWEAIRRRIKAAGEGDFVVVFYNPRSSGRGWQLDEARLLLLNYRKPSTPVGVVTDASRVGQRVEITTLGDLDTRTVGMTTTVVVGSTQTRVIAGRMVTPRGYE